MTEEEAYAWFEERGISKDECKDNPTLDLTRTPMGFLVSWIGSSGEFNLVTISYEEADWLVAHV